MENYYKKYIKTVTEQLSPDAAAELAYDETFRKYMEKMSNPLFWLLRRHSPDVMINYIYWEILRLYARTNLVNNDSDNDMNNFKAVMVSPNNKAKMRAYAAQAYTDAASHPFGLTRKRFNNMQFLVTNVRLEKLGHRNTHK